MCGGEPRSGDGHQGHPSFQYLYERFRPGLRRYVGRLVGETEAEDVTREVFARVDQALPSFRGDSTVSTWIYRIATNAAMERLRRRAPVHDDVRERI